MTQPNPLAAFTGTYGGVNTSSGINTIYVPSKNGPVLKIHRIREEFKFISQQGLFGVPVNRGSAEDISIFPVIYDQYVADNDVPETLANLTSGAGVIHQEAGMFLLNPASTVPVEKATVQRLGSLPHGVAFNAQGYITTISGPPTIPPMNTADAPTPNGIQPFVDADQLRPAPKASTVDAAKFPPNVLADPNVLLRTALSSQKVISTIIIATDTQGTDQLPGGGVTNSAFTLTNAECIRQRSTFFVMKVSGWFGPQDLIMYTQEVLLRFPDGVVYPHVTVAALSRDPFPTPIIF